MPENSPCVTCRWFNYRPQKKIKHVFFFSAHDLLSTDTYKSSCACLFAPTAYFLYECFKKLFCPERNRHSWPGNVGPRAFTGETEAPPHNDMGYIWIIWIFWINLLLKAHPFDEGPLVSWQQEVCTGSVHGCPHWNWTGWISSTSLDPDRSCLPFGTHLFPQFKVLEVRWRLHYSSQGNNLYNHSQSPLRRNELV